MSEIIKEYSKGLYFLLNSLAAAFICVFNTIKYILRDDVLNTWALSILIVLSIFSLAETIFLLLNMTYVQITDESLKVFPRFFFGRVKSEEWKNVFNLEVRGSGIMTQMVIFRLKRNDLKIYIGHLSKKERAKLIQIIDDAIRNKSEV